MQIDHIKISDLSLDPANVRKHDRKNLDAIKASLRKFGQQKPIVVDAKGIVIAGNGTMTAAQELGWTEIVAVRTDLSGVEATAFAIADNRSAELAEWNDELGDVLKSLSNSNIDLNLLGFDESDLDKIYSEKKNNDDKKEAQIFGAMEVIAECESEDHQQLAYNLLTEKGYKCRLITL
jgi:ParB-like chromosome segregation protein Spo0J